eukprot:COSAG06_NODE_3740_length_4957_cov_8.283821_3_plen_122_part_00
MRVSAPLLLGVLCGAAPVPSLPSGPSPGTLAQLDGRSDVTNCSVVSDQCTPSSQSSPAYGRFYPRTVYAEHSGRTGQDWGERITTAIQTTYTSTTVRTANPAPLLLPASVSLSSGSSMSCR